MDCVKETQIEQFTIPFWNVRIIRTIMFLLLLIRAFVDILLHIPETLSLLRSRY